MDVRRRESSHFGSELAGRGSAVINHVYRLRDSTTGLLYTLALPTATTCLQLRANSVVMIHECRISLQ